jgi:exopolysaccharide biosynthesis polyprenyl glycosylphosphotransferase
MFSIVVIFVISFGVSLGVTPLVRALAIRWKVGDYPGARKVNTVFMPRMGGIGIIAGIAAGMTIAVVSFPWILDVSGLHLLPLLIALGMIVGLGMYDDIIGVGSFGKLIVQTVASMLVMYSGLGIEFLSVPFLSPIRLVLFGPMITLLWLIGITNAVNLLDGLDGLAAGVSAIVAASFLAMGIYAHDWVVVVATLSLLAGCLGFLRYNFNPASIFMGDTGSLFLGFFLACLSLRIIHYPAGQEGSVSLLAVVVALAVPIVDTSVAFFRRLRRGLHPLKPDKEHIHHRVMDLGFTHRQTVVTIYFVSAFNATISLLLVYLDSMYATVLLAVMVFAVFVGIRRLGYVEEMRVRDKEPKHSIQPLSVARVIDRLVLLSGDTVALVLAFAMSYFFRFESGVVGTVGYVPLEMYVISPAMLLLTLGWLAMFALTGLYDIPWDASRIDYAMLVFKVVAAGTLMLFLLTFDFSSPTIEGRITTVVYGGAVGFFVVFMRMIIIAVERKYEILGFRRRNTLLVGISSAAEDLLDDIERRPGLKYTLVGVVDREKTSGEFKGLPVLGTYKDIPATVREKGVEEILVAANYLSREEILDILAQCNGMVPDIKVVPESLDVLGGFKFEEVVGHPLIRLHPTNMDRWQWIAKRFIDILVSLLVLVPLLPVWLFVALLIRLDSPGSVFHVQERVGKKGRIFKLYKFRSMIPDAERDTGPVWAQPEDKRITRVGRIIRKLRIDEIPQFINVLKGEMSLVGPRPERSYFVEQLKHEVSFYSRRLLVRPGITGWAQVRHRYDRSLEDVKEKIKYDLYYLENMSLTLDFKIILRTFIVASSGKGTH